MLSILIGTLLLNGSKSVAKSRCDIATELSQKELYEQAISIYQELLKYDPQSDCAKTGIRSSIEKEYQKTLGLYRNNRIYKSRLENILKKYLDFIIVDIKVEASKSISSAISSGFLKEEDKFAPVRTLANLGLYAEAREKLKKVIEANPTAIVPADLEYLSGGKIAPWRQFLHALEPFGQPIVEMIIAVLLVILLVSMLKRLIYQESLNIEGFEKGGSELEIGKILAAMVEEELQNADSKEDYQGKIPKMTLVAAPLGKLELPDVKSVAPQLSIVSQLINILPNLLSYFPRVGQNSFILSGYLHPHSERGAGITLSLKRDKGEIVANCTIWQKDFDPELTVDFDNAKDSSLYYCLAEPAAIWTLFQLDKPIDKLKVKEWSGVDNWKSYAYFRAGVYWRLKGENDKARCMFNSAINEDYKNRFALLNLGNLDTLKGDYDHAIKKLKLAKTMSKQKKYYLSRSRIY
jgi:tetratricopeptide (TPR) repeat protein